MPELTPESRLGAGIQEELIPIEEQPDDFWAPEEVASTEKEKPRYTARRFFLKRPIDYRQCIQLLAAGAGLLKVARLLHVHHETVAAVRDVEVAEIDIQKQRIKRNIRLAVEVGSERLPDIMATLPDCQVPIATAVLIDKAAQLDGEPTQRVEVTVRDARLTHEAVKARIEAFPEAIDVESTVMGAAETDQKGLLEMTARQVKQSAGGARNEATETKRPENESGEPRVKK